MIHAKPLKRKDLGPMPEPVSASESTPTRHQINFNLGTNHDQSNISRITVKRGLNSNDRKKLILRILKDIPGLSSFGIASIMRKFCESQGYSDSIADYNFTLRTLMKEKEITRIKVLGKWRYIPYVR